MKIETSYFGNIRNLQGKVLISISRYSPKWFTGKELKILAPEKYYMHWNEPEYKIEFKKKLAVLNPELIKKEIELLSNNQDCVLLCYEKPNEFCHRHIISDWLNKNTEANIKEFKLESLEQTIF